MSVSPLLGRQLGRYVLIESLGRGGMAEVFRARDGALARTVAIKVIQSGLAADPQFVERFLREARLVAALDHPHILPLWDLGEADGLPFLVMPCLDGGSLARRMTGAPLPLAEVVVCIRQLAEALDFAHQAGILHRDVKPANVLIGRGSASTSASADDGAVAVPSGASAAGLDARFVLADFGIAKASDSATRLTVTGSVVGTPVYMAPELAQGKSSSPASDRYALAVMAFELLTGSPPFAGENALSLMHQHVSGEVPAVSSRVHGLPRATDYLFRAALAKEPERRPPSSRALADALALLLPLESRQALGVAGVTQTTQPWYQLPAGAVPAVAASADRRAARDWRHAPDTPTRAEGTVGTRVRATDPTMDQALRPDDPDSLELAPTARHPPLAAAAMSARAGSGAAGGGGHRRFVLVVALLAATAAGAFLAQRFLFAPSPTGALATEVVPAAEPPSPAVAEPVPVRAANSGPGVDPSGGGEVVRPEPAPSTVAPPEVAPAMTSALSALPRPDVPVAAGGARRDAIELRSYQRRPSREDYEAALAVARSGAGAGLPEALVLPLVDLASGGLAYLGGDLATARRHAEDLGQRELAISLAGALPAALWRAEGRGEPSDWALAVLFGDPSGLAAGGLASDLAAYPDAPSLLMAQAVLARLDGRAAEAARLGAAVWASGPEAALAGGVAAFLGEQASLDGDRARGLEWYQRAVSSAAPPAARGTWALLAARMARDLRQPGDVRRLTLLACELGVRVACQPPTAPAGGRRVLRPQRPR
jgi:serine/threonine-protein kinase